MGYISRIANVDKDTLTAGRKDMLALRNNTAAENEPSGQNFGAGRIYAADKPEDEADRQGA